MAKFTVNNLFKGVRGRGSYIYTATQRDDASGFAFTMGGGSACATIDYRGDNSDRSFIQLLAKRFEKAQEPSSKEREELTTSVAEKLAALKAVSVEAPIGSLFGGFAFCEPAVSNDDTRYNLNALYVENGRMVATDGHRLNYRDDGFPVVDRPLLMPIADVRSVVRTMLFNWTTHRVKTYRYAVDDLGIAFFTESPTLTAAFYVRDVDGSFPDYTQVIPTSDPTAVIRSTGAAWSKAFAKAPVVMGDKAAIRTTRMRIGQSQVWIEAKDGERFPMPAKVENSDQRNSEVEPLTFFNADYLAEMIDADGELVIEYRDELTPLVFKQGPALAVIMPMRG